MDLNKRESGDGEEAPNELPFGASAILPDFSDDKLDKKVLDWKENEFFLNELINLGIDRNTARKALYYTRGENESVEKAFDWIFQSENAVDLCKTTLEEDLGLVTKFSLDNVLDKLKIDNQSFKMVFVINSSLNMGIGKMVSQTAHAVMSILEDLCKENVIADYHNWISNGQKKVVLKGESTNQLLELKEKANKLNLANQIIQDAGRTEIAPGSYTVLVIFGSDNKVDLVTGKLQLLK